MRLLRNKLLGTSLTISRGKSTRCDLIMSITCRQQTGYATTNEPNLIAYTGKDNALVPITHAVQYGRKLGCLNEVLSHITHSQSKRNIMKLECFSIGPKFNHTDKSLLTIT